MNRQPCSHSVYRGHFLRGRCHNEGVVEENGKWFCRIHSSEGKQKRQEKNQARWKEEAEFQKARWAKADEDRRAIELFPEVVEALRELIFASTGLVEEKYLRDARSIITKVEGK